MLGTFLSTFLSTFVILLIVIPVLMNIGKIISKNKYWDEIAATEVPEWVYNEIEKQRQAGTLSSIHSFVKDDEVYMISTGSRGKDLFYKKHVENTDSVN